MWIAIVCLLIAVTVTSVQSENDDIKNFPITAQRNKAYFEDRILREFDGSKIQIFSRDDITLDQDIKAIVGENLITLKNLKLVNKPVLIIASLNSTLDLLSIRLSIDVGELVFSGKIYVNQDTEPAGDVRYTLRNVKGLGLVGLAVAHDGNFVSTNYFIDYAQDNMGIETTWEYENLEKQELGHPLFYERQLKAEFAKVINRMLKKRLDFALAKISAMHVFELGLSKVLEIEKSFHDFYGDIVDGIIYDLNIQVEGNGMAQIVLPDFNAPFTYRVLGIDVRGQVLGSEGWIRNLTTFVRRGPISLGYASGNFIIFGSLGLTELKLGYGICAVKVAGIGPSGHISGTIGTNRVDLALSINLRNQSITLVNFEIADLSDIDVEVTGLGLFNWLASRIADRVIASSKTYIISTIEPMIKEQIDQALANLVPFK